MFRASLIIFTICAGLMFAFYAQNKTYAQSIEEAMATPAPEPVQVIVTPTRVIHCSTIKEGFLGGVWVTEHRVCRYQNDKSNRVWVESHWTCYQYDANSCMSWISWSSGWEKLIDVYQLRATHHRRYTPRQSYANCYPCGC